MIEPKLSPRQRRLRTWIQLGVSAFYLLPIGIGLRELASGRVPVGVMLTSVFGVLFVLSLRRVRYGSDFVEQGPNRGDIASPYFDLIIFSVVVVPIIMIGFLVWTLVVDR